MAKVVYEHHERNDGSGYPLRLQGAQIHEMSKIVAIAEVYDALISDTSYRKRYTPEASYNSIRAGEHSGLDGKAIKAFQKYIVPYPLNSFVLLDTQEVGRVVEINRQNVFKPTIKVGTETVNLAEQSKRSIVTSHFQAY
jgi:HD-GYP domain-containing protein (c-di-GMP phosphodiesterase class II)